MFGNAFSNFRIELAKRFRDDALIYLFIAIYALAGIGLLFWCDAIDHAAYSIYVYKGIISFGIIMPVVAFLFDLCWPIHRFPRRRKLVFKRVFSPKRLADFVAGLCLMQAMTLFFGTFTSIKNVLPILNGGFPHDRLQADIDHWLHGGTDPWRLIQIVGGTDIVRAAVEFNYNVLWSFVCYGALFFVVTSPRARNVRVRYVFSFMLVWIVVGNLLAGMFLSAGPAFYGYVTGDTARFADQLAFLAGSRESIHSAANFQAYLWSKYVTGQVGFGSGVSAFPSVHVGLISINAFFAYAVSRKFGIVALVYVGLVCLSSVYLAWHYAIDGYAALAVAGVIFFSLRKIQVSLRTPMGPATRGPMGVPVPTAS